MSTTTAASITAAPGPEDLRARIDACMLADRRSLRRRLERAAATGGEALHRVTRDIERSAARRRERTLPPPGLECPPGLPIGAARARIAEAIAAHPVVVVSGETGSGKTTQLPKICLEVGRGSGGLIGHTQPRRLAARSVAGRIARETGTALGDLVGYQVRFKAAIAPTCRVKVMTDGILLAEIQGDPELWSYDTVIVDEAHERSLNIDFALGYLKRLLGVRPDLKVVISSATIDTQRFSDYFDGAPVVEVSGRGFPVETRYREPAASRDPEAALGEAVAAAVGEVCGEGPGDVLVFLPTERDIRDAGARLRGMRLPGTEILPLYARLPLSHQERVFEPHAGRRVVLATNVAETSLTVPGVRYVVDTGLARISRYSHRSAVQRLPVEPVSRASADQRRGRCGRTGPGICVRLYAQEDYESRPAFTDPEVRRSNLAAVLLRLRALGIDDIADFPFLDAPERRHVNDGHRLLCELGALDAEDRLTKLGRSLARLPLDPRVGRMLIEAGRQRCVREVLVLAAALSVGDPRERTSGPEAAAAHERYADGRSDFMSLLKVWQHVRGRPRAAGSWTAFCHRHRLSPVRLREWQDVHDQLRDVVRDIGLRAERGEPASYGRIHRALLSGLLRHVGSRSGPREYQGVRDVAFVLSPGSSQHAARPRWVVAGELVETARLYAFQVASIRPEWVERASGNLLRRSHFEAHWDADRAEAMVYEQTSLHGLTVVPRRRVRYAPVSRADARDIFIRAALVEERLATDAGWLQGMRAVVARLREFDHKLRRPDVAVSDASVFAFYDALLPEEVCDGHSFEVWWRRCEREEPQRLRMTPEDVSTAAPPDVGASFPDVLAVRGSVVPLHYRFAPGEADDGITATLSAGLLAEYRGEDFEWLVPGRLEEKVELLLRWLPKSIRRELQPLTGAASDFVAGSVPGQGSLLGSLRAFLRLRNGIDVPEPVWRRACAGREVPAHLAMRFRVQGDDPGAGAVGRDLAGLQRRLGAAVPRRVDAAPPRVGEILGMREWRFDRLPDPADEIRDGLRVRKHPALLDRGDGVDLVWVESPGRARAATRAGVLRLFMLDVGRDLRRVCRRTPGLGEVELRYAMLGACPLDDGEPGGGAREDLEHAIAAHAFAGDPAGIRTRARFEAASAAARERLDESARELCALAQEILERHRTVRELRDAHDGVPGAVADVDSQLAHLVYRGFLARTPPLTLYHLPRYLDALALRLGKIARGGARDGAKLAQVAPLWDRYLRRRREHAARGRTDAELDRYRWMLEEYRVSLFAQELGTAYSVSRKRLDAQWEAVSS